MRLLVSSYGCAAETADIEFAWFHRHAIDKGTNLSGKYEFVLTTHIDKNHVHNHLIFNVKSKITAE